MTGGSSAPAAPWVLVVDDDETLLKVLAMRFELEGFGVLSANSGEVALEVAHARRPDVIVLDAMMPGISGLEVCRSVRASEVTADTPILMLTAHGGLEFEAVAAGANRFIEKPFDLDELCELVHSLAAMESPLV